MSKVTKLALALVVGLFVVAGAPRLANAATGYVCNVNILPNGAQYGSAGYLYASFSSAPGCQGTFLGIGFICSAGATDPNCNSYNEYTAPQFNLLFTALHTAATTNEKVGFYVGGNSIISSLQFMGLGYPY
jgi:hypothetical protein